MGWNLPVEHAAACQSGPDAISGHPPWWGDLRGRRCRFFVLLWWLDVVCQSSEQVDVVVESAFYLVYSFFDISDFAS